MCVAFHFNINKGECFLKNKRYVANYMENQRGDIEHKNLNLLLHYKVKFSNIESKIEEILD